MVNIDEYKSSKNRALIASATFKMMKDKYNINVEENKAIEETFVKIINSIIQLIGNDVVLLNKNIKIGEINNLTLTKIKEYIEKQINIGNIGNVENTGNAGSVDNTIVVTKKDTIELKKDLNAFEVVSEDDDLVNKMHELEEKRRASSALLNDLLASSKNELAELATPLKHLGQEVKQNEISEVKIPQVSDAVYKKINEIAIGAKRANKIFIVNSHNRDWINQPLRNTLHFNISIDLIQNIVAPLKILFPAFVKDLTAYVVMHLTDGTRLQKYYFIFTQSNGYCDVWEPMQTTENISLAAKNWKITLYDCMNNELSLGNDGYNVVEVSNFNIEGGEGKNYFKIKIAENIEYELKHMKDGVDNLLLHTFNSKIIPIKLIKKNITELIVYNDDLKLEDFLQSKVLFMRSQYTLVFTYSSKD